MRRPLAMLALLATLSSQPGVLVCGSAAVAVQRTTGDAAVHEHRHGSAEAGEAHGLGAAAGLHEEAPPAGDVGCPVAATCGAPMVEAVTGPLPIPLPPLAAIRRPAAAEHASELPLQDPPPPRLGA